MNYIEIEASYFMKKALQLAKEAAEENEIPVGAVIVYQNQVIATGKNRREKGKNALYHAEIESIDKACQMLGGWRLPDCDLYVTLEPCPMCAGAIINARIRKVYFGAYDMKGGACVSLVNLFDLPYNHTPLVKGGILEEESVVLLKNFFQNLRQKK